MNNICRIIVVCILSSLGLACRSHNKQTLPSVPNSSEQVRELLSAAEHGNAQEIRKMLEAGVDINQIEHGWGTALYRAVFSEDVNAVKLLVECGADVNKGDEDGHAPLHAATESESDHAFEMARILISHGADVNAKIKSDIVPDGWVHISEGRTPLHNAASVSLVSEDLESYGNRAVVELLLSHGANANAKDSYGCTPLYDALFAGFLDVMELLIEHGAEVNAKNDEDGGTVLHDAAYYGDLEAVKLLISHGADIHIRDFEGETPLHKAALQRDQDIVNYLTMRGANLLTPSKRNETPQDFLNEPNETNPILLWFSEEKVFALIVTDGLVLRMKLKSELIDYDTIWFPSKSDIEGLDLSLKKWIKEDAPKAKDIYVDPDYILTHFDQYNREYAGFMKDGIKYIVCNMVQASTDTSLRSPPRNSFSGIWDGGCAQVVLVFEAQTKQVVRFRCNNR